MKSLLLIPMLALALLIPATAATAGTHATTAEKLATLTARVNALEAKTTKLEAKTTKLETAVAGLPTVAGVEALIDLKLVPINLRLIALEKPPVPSCTVTQYEGSGFITFLKNAKPSTFYTVQIGHPGEQNYATANATTDPTGTAQYEGNWIYNGQKISVLWFGANPVASCTS
jgi:hypothetical protein